MASPRLYTERVTHLIDRIGGRSPLADPFSRFRRRAFIVMLLILALIAALQAVTAWMATRSSVLVIMMSFLCVLVLICLAVTRRSPRMESTAAFVLMLLTTASALIEVMAERSPNTPLVYWSPVLIFGGYVFCGLRQGTLTALCLILCTLAIEWMPFVWNDARSLPGGTMPDAFQKRLLVTVTLCHLLPLCILGMYEKFFALCHDEARLVLDEMEGRKDRALLGRLAQVIAHDMEPELQRMEHAYEKLHHGGAVRSSFEAVLEPLQRLVHLTRRYEPLSTGALVAIEKGLSLQNFPEILQRFTDFAAITMEDEVDPDFRFRGGQAFFLLIFLCMSLRELMENPGVQLERVSIRCHAQHLEVVICLQSEERELHLSLAQDFLHDMEARIRSVCGPEKRGTRRLEIEVPLLRS